MSPINDKIDEGQPRCLGCQKTGLLYSVLNAKFKKEETEMKNLLVLVGEKASLLSPKIWIPEYFRIFCPGLVKMLLVTTKT